MQSNPCAGVKYGWEETKPICKLVCLDELLSVLHFSSLPHLQHVFHYSVSNWPPLYLSSSPWKNAQCVRRQFIRNCWCVLERKPEEHLCVSFSASEFRHFLCLRVKGTLPLCFINGVSLSKDLRREKTAVCLSSCDTCDACDACDTLPLSSCATSWHLTPSQLNSTTVHCQLLSWVFLHSLSSGQPAHCAQLQIHELECTTLNFLEW